MPKIDRASSVRPAPRRPVRPTISPLRMSKEMSSEDDIAAEVLGVRMMRTQANAFVLSTFIAGVAGGLLAVNLEYIRPDEFGVHKSVEYLAIIVIGGLASLWGPVLGALFVTMVPVIVDLFEHEHVIALACGERSIRFRPALVVTAEEIDEAVGALERSVARVASA